MREIANVYYKLVFDIVFEMLQRLLLRPGFLLKYILVYNISYKFYFLLMTPKLFFLKTLRKHKRCGVCYTKSNIINIFLIGVYKKWNEIKH